MGKTNKPEKTAIYIYVKDGIAVEAIPEFDAAFPGIPAARRYSAEFMRNTVRLPEDFGETHGEIKIGWVFNKETFEFIKPEPEAAGEEPEPEAAGESEEIYIDK